MGILITSPFSLTGYFCLLTKGRLIWVRAFPANIADAGDCEQQPAPEQYLLIPGITQQMEICSFVYAGHRVVSQSDIGVATHRRRSWFFQTPQDTRHPARLALTHNTRQTQEGSASAAG